MSGIEEGRLMYRVRSFGKDYDVTVKVNKYVDGGLALTMDYIEFSVVCMSEDHIPAVKEWLEYGYWNGLGQWRNAGKGRFVYEILDDEGNVIEGNTKLAAKYLKTA